VNDFKAKLLMARLLASSPPRIVQAEPRYQQFDGQKYLIVIPPEVEPGSSPMPLWHLDGIEWFEAPAPPKRHQHWAQTVACLKPGQEVWRCPCGAITDEHEDGWIPNGDAWVGVENNTPKRHWWQRKSE
jgi:hypothetical protein